MDNEIETLSPRTEIELRRLYKLSHDDAIMLTDFEPKFVFTSLSHLATYLTRHPEMFDIQGAVTQVYTCDWRDGVQVDYTPNDCALGECECKTCETQTETFDYESVRHYSF
jgi:hypothetical protein